MLRNFILAVFILSFFNYNLLAEESSKKPTDSEQKNQKKSKKFKLDVKAFIGYMNSIGYNTIDGNSVTDTSLRGYYISADIKPHYWFAPGIIYNLQAYPNIGGSNKVNVALNQLTGYFSFGPKVINLRLGYSWETFQIANSTTGMALPISDNNRSLMYVALTSEIWRFFLYSSFRTGFGAIKSDHLSNEFRTRLAYKFYKYYSLEIGYDRRATGYKNSLSEQHVYGGIGILY